jgi:gas vesicle protein
VNKLFKLLLKTAMFVLDQTSEQVDRASDSVSGMIDRGKEMIEPEDNRMRNVISFAAGIGVGIGAAILFAPASGAETRSSIKGKVREFRGQAV